MIKSLVRRMKILEQASKQSRSGSIVGVQKLALTMLSEAELEQLQMVNVLLSGNGVAALTDAHRTIWSRWDHALAAATKQLQCPVELTATDLRL